MKFSKYFRSNLSTLLHKDDDYLKQWLQVIGQASILMDPTNLAEDEFSTSKALQQWIGISYHIEDQEGLPPLQQAIKEELQLGLKGLPQEYKELFSFTHKTIKQSPLQWQQECYYIIIEAREQFDCANLLSNEFSYARAMRDWVGLV